MLNQDTYLPQDTYRALVKALAEVKPDAWSGGLEDQIRIVLGEVGDIWPDTILEEGRTPTCHRTQAEARALLQVTSTP